MKQIYLILKKTLSLVIFLSLGVQAAFGQTGKIVGKITDAENAEELIGATVSVVGTMQGGVTDLDGTYTINIKPGSYDLRVSYVGYQQKLIRSVAVAVGKVTRQDIQLRTEGVAANEIVVEAEMSTATEGALLAERRKALSVSDGISSELIKRTPDSDAGEAVKRTTGISVVGGKYVFVRGLGERYSSTQLNGVTIPSPEPEKKVVPLDLIPANLIENITTIKTFLPDQPGNFAGGLVRIKTKEFPDEFQFNFSASTGINSRSHFLDIPGYNGGSLDFLGFDDGTRDVLGDIRYTKTQFQSKDVQVQVARQFENTMSPDPGRYAPNQSYSVSLADQVSTFGNPLGYIFSLSYGSSTSYLDKDRFLPSADRPNFDFNERNATSSVTWGGVFNVNMKLGESDKIGLKTTYNRSADDEARVMTGTRASTEDQPIRSTRLRYVERDLLSSQLAGTHYLGWLGNSEFEWKAAFSRATRLEPDNRETSYWIPVQAPDGQELTYTADPVANRNVRFFSDLNDNEWDGMFDWSIPFDQWNGLKSKLKIGALYTYKTRDFSARTFRYQIENSTEAYGLQPEDLFTSEMIEAGVVSLQDNTQDTDSYTADETTLAGYVMVELPLTSQLRFVGGARIEQNNVDVLSRVRQGTGYKDLNGGFDETNLLPSINLIYALNQEMNLRVAFSNTVAQPELREMAPFRFDDYVSSTFGNPLLKQTKVQNYDLRWEWFPRLGELIAVSAFYKDFTDPIERVVFLGATLNQVPINAENARNFGLEFEVRKKLDFISSSLENFGMGLNLTLVDSKIELGDNIPYVDGSGQTKTLSSTNFASTERSLQGQSPYVLNVNLTYDNPAWLFSGTVLYNVAGRRISEVGYVPGNDYVYDDIYEEAHHQVDLTLSKKMWTNLNFKLTVKNLLDNRYKFTIGDVVYERYNSGISYSLSVSYAL